MLGLLVCGSMATQALFDRLLLSRRLGAGTFQFFDNGRERVVRMRYRCGCVAREREPNRFRLFPCTSHAESLLEA